MSQADGYVRIVTQNDTTEAQRSTEELGDAIQEALDTSAADKMTDVLLDIQKSIEQLGSTISGAADQMIDAFGEVEDGLDDTGDAALKTGDIIKANLLSEAIKNGVQKLGDVLKDTASRAIEVAGGMDKGVRKIASATNASAEDMENLKDVIKAIYGDNFGESAEDIADSISKIKQNLGDLSDEELINITESAYALQDVFDYGIDESSRAVKAMMENFNVSAAEAYDYIARGAQNGLDYSGELLDNISEYSVQFKKMGLSASDMFTIFENGAQNGAWNLDKIGDSVKELAIRVIDGSDTSKQGFEALNFNADDMAKKFAKGGDTARAAFQEVITALAAMDDPVAQNTAGINLMGTMWEDMGAQAVLALGDISDSAYDCSGALDGIKDVNYGSLSDSIDSVKRQIDLLIEPIGERLIPLIDEAADAVSEAADQGDIQEIAASVAGFVSGTLTLLLKNIKLITSAVTGVTAAFIAFKTAAMITKVIQSWQTAVLQVKLLGSAQGVAAVKTAALNGQLTVQETIYALLSGKLDVATVKQMALNTAMSMNPAGLIAAAVGLLATVLTGFALNAASAADEVDDLNSSAESLNQAAHDLNQTAMESDQAAQEVRNLIDEYKNIKSASDNTEEAKRRLKDIQDTLVTTYDVEAEKLDLVNGKYEDQLSILQKVADKKNETARMAANAAYFNARDIIQSGYSIDISDSGIDFSDKIGREIFEKMLSDNKIPAKISEDGKKLIFDTGTTYEQAEKYLVSWGKTLETGISLGGSSGLYSWISNAALEAQAANEEYQKIVELYKQYNDFDTLGSGDKSPGTGTNSKKTGDFIDVEAEKKKFKTVRDEMKKEYELGEIDAAAYYSKLESLRDKYLSNAVESDEWHDATLEIKKYRDQLTEEQKKAYEKQLEAQKKADEEAKKQAEKAAQEAATARKQAYTDGKSELEFQLKTKKITEKEYYAALDKIRDKYLDKNTSEWRSAFLETYEYNQKIVQANKDALEKLLSDTRDSTLTALEKITSARDSLTAKLTDFNKTFEKVTETIPETVAVKGDFTITTAEHDEETYKMGADSIEDNIRVLEKYGNMLDALKARGADESTLSSILDMDIEEGMKFGAKLLQMSDSEWDGYFASLEKLNQTAADISKKYYQNQVDDLKENFVDKLRGVFTGMNSDMYQVGVDSAKEFVKGWNEKMGTTDLTLGDIMNSVKGGTMATAPTAAKSMSVLDIVKLPSDIPSLKANIPIYIGTQKLVDLIVDLTNGKIIQTGKNVLMT